MITAVNAIVACTTDIIELLFLILIVFWDLLKIFLIHRSDHEVEHGGHPH